MARFYLDANLSRALQRALSAGGHEVEYAIDLGFGDESDPFHLYEAARRRLCLVTINAQDFRTLHRQWTSLTAWKLLSEPHSGIISSTTDPRTADWARAIHHLAASETLGGRMFIWDPEREVWYRDKF